MAKSLTGKDSPSRYAQLIERIFFGQNFGSYQQGKTEIPFERLALTDAARELGIELPKNLGDILYSIRYRQPMPESILKTQPENMEWIIEGIGSSKYCFCLVPVNRIVPNPELATIKIPDATPEIIRAYALSDEQALLARVRYNRLVDIFLGITAYSLQNHLRTTVKSVGQIEIDEIYVGVDRHGSQYIVPVQAKGGNDKLSTVQTKQDYLYCQAQYPE
ncbi:MAG: endonuclease, partial [Acidobacteriota bacterium]|nr:endonuclease [Acidobacteriota bacterium]